MTNKQAIKTLPLSLQEELSNKLTLIRLSKAGFFKRADVPHLEIANELLLHRAVLDKALIDSFSMNSDIREEVEDWLDLTNPDFIACCENAMLDPNGVFAVFKHYKQLVTGKNARFNGFQYKEKNDK